MYKVLIIQGGNNGEEDFKQMPDRFRGPDSKYKFYFNECDGDPDIVVVRNKYLKKARWFNVAPSSTILMLSEPRTVVNFPRLYRNQFGLLYTCQEGTIHRNVKFGPAWLPWFVGVKKVDGKVKRRFSYADFNDTPLPAKTKLISVITSNKAFTRGHQERLDFVRRLKEHYGDKIDVFGRGIRDFDDKWDVLAPYKYHIAIENSQSKFYWTEKLSDCYLAGSFPIYYGCTNVGDYFPAKGYATIDIHDFDSAVATIDRVIAENEYERSQEALVECRRLVVDDYNLFTILANCCDVLVERGLEPRGKGCKLRPALTGLDPYNFYNYAVRRNFFAVERFFKKVFGKKDVI